MTEAAATLPTVSIHAERHRTPTGEPSWRVSIEGIGTVIANVARPVAEKAHRALREATDAEGQLVALAALRAEFYAAAGVQ